MVTDLIFVRHGESTWNQEGRVQGWLDPPLSEKGIQQARCVAERLRRESCQALYTSPLQRARTTSEIIGQAVGLAPIVDDRLREHRLGEIEGLRLQEIQARFPTQFARVRQSNLWVPAPGEEPVSMLTERMRAVGNEVSARHPGATIIIVSHGGAITRLLMAWLGVDWQRHPVFHLDNASITRVRLEGPLIQLRTLNDTAHLQADIQPADVQTHW